MGIIRRKFEKDKGIESDERIGISYNDLPGIVKIDYINSILNLYEDIEIISEPTIYYNYHSYAWYSQYYLENNIWIQYPTAYYIDTDRSYERVYNPKVGDIICYYDLNLPTQFKKQLNLDFYNKM